MAALCVVHVSELYRTETERADLLGPLAEKNSPGMAMTFPGAQAQAMSASRGGGLHIDARNFAGAYSSAGPVSGKNSPGMAMMLPGAQAQAMSASRGSGVHIDARKFAAPRFELNKTQTVNVFFGRCDIPAAYLDTEPSKPDLISRKDRTNSRFSTTSTDAPDSPMSGASRSTRTSEDEL